MNVIKYYHFVRETGTLWVTHVEKYLYQLESSEIQGRVQEKSEINLQKNLTLNCQRNTNVLIRTVSTLGKYLEVSNYMFDVNIEI